MTRPSLLGAVLAVIVGVATFVYLGDGEADARVGEIATVEVVVANRDIDVRTRVSEDDLKLVDIPATAAHPRALRAIDDATGLFASGFIAAGEQILPHHLAEEVFGGGLALLIPQGQRAVSIAISNAAAAGGLLSPGDRIDVIAIFDEDLRGEAGTAIVAEDIEVLALSQLVLGDELKDGEENPTASSSPNAVSATITVAVSLDDAQRIALASSFGELHVLLRRPDDDSDTFAAPVDLESVVRG